MREAIGRTLGPYRIVAQLGAGGMAIVYKAYQPAMDRYVALKIPSSSLLEDAAFRARFQREARTIAQLEHPHILPVHDFGEDDGIPYLVMRYVDGGTLRDLASRGLLPLERSIQLIAEVADALAYAHTKGFIHRDVKPANVLLDRDGTALLTDFGIAKMVEQTMALTGSVAMGTPYYMSPEQVSDKPVDARTDVYALGVMLYELLTGRRPFEGETPLAVALKHVTDQLPPPRQVSPSLPEDAERIILKAMAKDPADRYQTASDLARDLRRLLFALERAANSDVASNAISAAPVNIPNGAPSFDRSATGPIDSPPPDPSATVAERAPVERPVPAAPVQRPVVEESVRRAPVEPPMQQPAGSPSSRRLPVQYLAVAGGVVVLVVIAILALRPFSGAPAATPTVAPTPVAAAPSAAAPTAVPTPAQPAATSAPAASAASGTMSGPSTITKGDSATLTYTYQNATHIWITGSGGKSIVDKAVDSPNGTGTVSVKPDQTTAYTLVAASADGTAQSAQPFTVNVVAPTAAPTSYAAQPTATPVGYGQYTPTPKP